MWFFWYLNNWLFNYWNFWICPVGGFCLEVGSIGGGGITGPFPPSIVGVTVRVLTATGVLFVVPDESTSIFLLISEIRALIYIFPVVDDEAISKIDLGGSFGFWEGDNLGFFSFLYIFSILYSFLLKRRIIKLILM